MKHYRHTIAWALLAGACLGAAAQTGNPPPGGQPGGPQDGPPRRPPPEALAACKGKADGAKVQFTGRRGETVKAVCKKIGDVMAAVPEGGPPPPDKPAH